MRRFGEPIARFGEPLGKTRGGGGGVAAPTSLTATPVSTSQIDLAWTDNATNEDGYKIYRSTNGVDYAEIDDIAADSESYSDTTITAGTTYYYKVAAYSTAGGEAESNVAAANTLTLNLISFWELEEASGTRVDSHGSNDLTDNNTVTQAAGKVGNAAQFTAANAETLSIAANADLNTGDVDFYFAAWIYADALAAAGEMWIGGKMLGSTNEWLIHKMSGDHRIRFTIRNAEVIIASTFGVISAETWYFVECWHSATAGQIGCAVNRTENSAARTTGPTAGTSEFVLGGRKGFSSYWDGRIDQAVFYKGRIPAEAERNSLYNSGNGRGYSYINPL